MDLDEAELLRRDTPLPVGRRHHVHILRVQQLLAAQNQQRNSGGAKSERRDGYLRGREEDGVLPVRGRPEVGRHTDLPDGSRRGCCRRTNLPEVQRGKEADRLTGVGVWHCF